MSEVLRLGVVGFTFDSAHYTKGISEKCKNLHGHTFRLDVETEGEVDPETGMVIDFLELKRIVREVISEYDHRVIVPRKDADIVNIEGPFNREIKVIDYPEATTEYIALDIARKIREKLGMKVRVRLFEGEKNYVVVER